MRDGVRFDTVSLASGIAVALLGAFTLLESEDALDFGLGWAAVIVTALIGVVFLLGGLAGGGERHDSEP